MDQLRDLTLAALTDLTSELQRTRSRLLATEKCLARALVTVHILRSLDRPEVSVQTLTYGEGDLERDQDELPF